MSKRQLLCNICGALGYLSCLLQWLWVAVIWMPAIMNTRVQKLLIPDHSAYQLPTLEFDAPSPLLTAIAVGVTIIVMAVTVIVLLRMPGVIAKTGQKLTHRSADALLPAVTHHKPVTKKERRRLTARLVKVMKLALVLVPFIGALAAYAQHLDLDFSLVVLVGGWLAIGSTIWFTLQYVFARLLRVPAEKLT